MHFLWVVGGIRRANWVIQVLNDQVAFELHFLLTFFNLIFLQNKFRRRKNKRTKNII